MSDSPLPKYRVCAEQAGRDSGECQPCRAHAQMGGRKHGCLQHFGAGDPLHGIPSTGAFLTSRTNASDTVISSEKTFPCLARMGAWPRETHRGVEMLTKAVPKNRCHHHGQQLGAAQPRPVGEGLRSFLDPGGGRFSLSLPPLPSPAWGTQLNTNPFPT